MRRIALFTMLILALTPAAAANASLPRGTWATVNACDQQVNLIGVRARMPGRAHQRLYMHFAAQWWSTKEQRFLPTGASSPWVLVGSGPIGLQAGWRFTFNDPPAGTEFVLRGVVRFQWKARKHGRWRTVRRASTFTTGGHTGVQGSEPGGSSDTFCVLKPAA